MEDDLDDFNETFLHYTFDIRLVRLVGRTFLPAKLTMEAEILLDEDADDSEVEMAFLKIRHWLDNYVSRSIVFRRENEAARNMLIDDAGMNRTGNFIMLTPGEPTDEHLGVLFQAKIGAIAAGTVGVGAMRVKADGPTGISVTFTGDAMEMLPSMQEWVGETPNFFETPWWSRSDTSMLDIVPAEDADLTKRPSWAGGFEMFDLMAQERDSEPVVIRPAFKPEVIEGGDPDTDDEPDE